MIRVLITDDHAIVRDGLRQIVGETNDITVAAEASTAAETLDRLRETSVDVVVLDLNLPDRHGLDLLLQLRGSHPRLPVLILSVNREAAYAIRLLKAGAAGYIGKDGAREQLIQGIRAVVRGEKYIAPPLAASVAMHLVSDGTGQRHEQLSDREFQVLLMIAAGKPPRQIAADLSVSVKTIGAHRAHVLQKMGLRSNAEIAQYVLTNKLM
jgi:two-component system, NarL family, invasion response regulator UvrY